MPENNGNKREKNGDNKKENNNSNHKEPNNKETKELNNIKNLEDFRGSSAIKNNRNNIKKDISYTEYYKIKTNIDLHRQQLKKHLEELEQLAKKKGIPTPSEVLAQEEKDNNKSRNQKIIEGGIIVLIFVVVLGAIAYISIASLFPNFLPFSATGYTIAAGDSKILSISEFYIDDTSVLGDKMTYQGTTIRPIISSKKFNLVFKPAKTIQPTKGTLSLSLVMLNNSNIYLNDVLIFPNLDNYELIKETDDGYLIYAKKDILENIDSSTFVDSGSASEFLYNNFPSSSVWSTSKLEAINPEVEGYTPEETLINTTFRGDLHLAVYAEETLNIRFTKQDLNSYLGADEYTINITDYEGNVVYTGFSKDDGIKEKGATGEEQNFEINQSVEEGVYYVNFIIDRDNSSPDSTLKNIKVNSNKVLILGNFLPIAPFSFYTKTNSPKIIGFYYWHSGKEQIITISIDENKIIDLNQSWYEKKFETNLSAGEHVIELEKGDLGVYSDIISPTKNSWFNIPLNPQDKFNNQDFLVIDSYTYDKDNGILNYEKEVEVKGNDKFSLRALENGAVAIESVNLEMG